jgi:predicted ATP-grasp superfamily ATP-dependent carboligase
MNPLYQQFGNQNNFLGQLNALKAKGGDPNQMIQEMLNSGRVSQSQYNAAVQRANQIMSMFTPSAHR